MTFQNLKRQVGKNLKYYDNTGGWLTDRDVTETDMGDFINDIYRDDLFPMFVTQYPQDFTQTGQANSWIANGTASAALTGSTLNATTSIFTNSMVGLYVWNDTDSTSTKITGYIDGDTVTVEEDDLSTWSNDSIYILGQEFSFGGDASDIYAVEQIGIKYNSTDQYYRNAVPRIDEDLFQVGSEIGFEGVPQYYLTSLTISGVLTSAVGILPAFKQKVSLGLQVKYVRKPAALSADGDVPRLPVDNVLIYGATARSFEKSEQFDKASYWTNKYEMYKKSVISRYRPMSTRSDMRIRPPRRFANIFYRYS